MRAIAAGQEFPPEFSLSSTSVRWWGSEVGHEPSLTASFKTVPRHQRLTVFGKAWPQLAHVPQPAAPPVLGSGDVPPAGWRAVLRRLHRLVASADLAMAPAGPAPTARQHIKPSTVHREPSSRPGHWPGRRSPQPSPTLRREPPHAYTLPTQRPRNWRCARQEALRSYGVTHQDREVFFAEEGNL